MARKSVPIYERGNPPLCRGGQGRSDQEVEETGAWFTLFLLMVAIAILACVLALAGGGSMPLGRP